MYLNSYSNSDDVFLPGPSNKRPHTTGDTSSILGDSSSILPPRRRPRLIDTLPDETISSDNMPPPVARSSISHPKTKTKSKEIPKTSRKTRSQTKSLIDDSEELSSKKDKTNRRRRNT